MTKRKAIITTLIVATILVAASKSSAEPLLETFITKIISSFQRTFSPPIEDKVVKKKVGMQEVKLEGHDLPYSKIIATAAQENGLDPMLIHAIIFHESRYERTAVSSKGAIGLMQLMPGTAHDLHVQDPYNPHQNIAGGASYYRVLLDEFGDHYRSLIAYNSGPGNVKKGVFYKESKAYAQNVIQTWKALRNNTAVNKEDN